MWTAEKLGRRWIGVEISKEYSEVIRELFKKEAGVELKPIQTSVNKAVRKVIAPGQ